jgi:hypothetical protein
MENGDCDTLVETCIGHQIVEILKFERIDYTQSSVLYLNTIEAVFSIESRFIYCQGWIEKQSWLFDSSTAS